MVSGEYADSGVGSEGGDNSRELVEDDSDGELSNHSAPTSPMSNGGALIVSTFPLSSITFQTVLRITRPSGTLTSILIFLFTFCQTISKFI